MTTLTTTQKKIWHIIRGGHWWSKRQLVIMLTGKEAKRHKMVEYSLPILVRKTAVKERWYRGFKIYSLTGSNHHLEHGLRSAEVITRFTAANPTGELIGEGVFREAKLGNVPEAGFKYPNGDLLLFEYCTWDNAKRSGLVSRKVKAYQRTLLQFEETFNGRGVVVFIIDLPIFEVKQMARRYLRHSAFIYFTDAHSFFNVALGDAFNAAIYFMDNGQAEALHV